MIKGIFSKVMWAGRATVFTVGLTVTLALMVGVATTALAAVPGDPFRLGRINNINTLSTLVGSASSSLLKIDNNGTGTALDLQVQPGKAPMKVNSGTKVANLNSDTVDGYDSFDFYQFGEKVQDSDNLDGIDSIEFFTQRTNSYIAEARAMGGGGGAARFFTASCDAGDKVSGGGGFVGGDGDVLRGSIPDLDYPVPGTDSWQISIVDVGPASQFDVYALCIDFFPFHP